MWAPSKLERWKLALMRDDVVVAPAEGVYGYCCDPFNDVALQKILSLKGRAPGKGLVVLVRNSRDLARFVDFSEYANDISNAMAAYWPGHVTLIMPAKSTISDMITGGRGTVAIRLVSTDYMLEYLNRWGGPLVSTSLNVTGQPPVRRAERIPPGAIALPLKHRLSGDVSRIFNVVTGSWER